MKSEKGRTISLLVVLAVASSCGGGGGEGCDVHIVSSQATSLGTTDTCGPEPIPPDVDITTSGTVITATYRELLMVCGGSVVVDLDGSAGSLTLTESVEGGGECGCFERIEVTVEVQVCEGGAYTLVVNEQGHDVSV
jgi:hypothetical protein